MAYVAPGLSTIQRTRAHSQPLQDASAGASVRQRRRQRSIASRFMVAGCPTEPEMLLVLLSELGDRHGDVRSIRAGLATLAASIALPRQAGVVAAATGTSIVATAASSVATDRTSQVYALRIIRALATTSEFKNDKEAARISTCRVADAAARFTDGEMQLCICETLATIFRHASACVTQDSIAGEAIARTIHLYNGDAKILRAALDAMCTLAKAGAHVSVENAAALVVAMRRHSLDANVQAAACAMLLAFVSEGHGRVVSAIELGVFSAALSAMREHDSDSRVQIFASKLLAVLVQEAPSLADNPSLGSIATTDAAAAILRAWPSHATSLAAREALQNAFSDIAAAQPAQAIMAVQRCGNAWSASVSDGCDIRAQPFLCVVAMRLAKASPKVQRMCCETLVRVVDTSERQPLRSATLAHDEDTCSSSLARRLVEAGALEAVVGVMCKNLDAGVQRAACEAIVCLVIASGPVQTAARAVSAGALGAAAAALRTVGVFPWLSHAALDVIGVVLAGSPTASAQAAAEEAGCREVAVSALLQHPKCRRVVDSATVVLETFDKLCSHDVPGEDRANHGHSVQIAKDPPMKAAPFEVPCTTYAELHRVGRQGRCDRGRQQHGPCRQRQRA